ncbi:MAG: ferrochelatase [Pseudomonadota bacterium]
MAYKNTQNFDHQQPDKTGVLISNLGTPDAPDRASLKRYLKEFLSDPRVVEFPRLLWWLVLNGVILNIRPQRSAKAYQKVWTEEGSPLALHTEQQAQKLKERLHFRFGDSLHVEWAMRYGNPSISKTLDKLMAQGVRKLLVLPLYPQYSASTTASTFDAIAADFTKRRWMPELRFCTSYHDYGPYIESLASSIKAHWQEHHKPQKLVFSYHGVPLRYLHNGDPYHCQCHKTSRLLADALGLSPDEYMTTFQSRFGREAWLQPYTDKTLEALPEKGVTDIQVVCPGFSADCLETIEEINMENREVFMEGGGKSFSYIPCLNATENHIDMLEQLVDKHLSGWDITAQSTTQRHEFFQACEHNQKSNS